MGFDQWELVLVYRLIEIDQKISLLKTFRGAKMISNFGDFKRNSILIFDLRTSQLEVRNYDSLKEAIDQYSEIEKKLSGTADIVLVRGENYDSIRSVFRNYFADVGDFMEFLEEALTKRPDPVA
jgi:hypothetical protein